MRVLVAVTVLLALAFSAQATQDVNGGYDCKYFTTEMITAELQRRWIISDSQMQKVLDSVKNVNNWLCKRCGTGLQALPSGFVYPLPKGYPANGFFNFADEYSQCRCQPGFGYYTLPGPAPERRTQLFYGCNQCPGNSPFSNPTIGPFFTGTKEPTAQPYLYAVVPRASNGNWFGTPCLEKEPAAAGIFPLPISKAAPEGN